ncbi:hypothetical protein ACFRCI_12950 [Streptomyces sp. NPDC056638]|uniref:hypothetical protein n=1 Tax=Streptomyces sp. NPDC056638 TaxID=3345887 RepID=UPI0036B0F25B
MLRHINGTALTIAALVATLGALGRPDRPPAPAGTAGAGAGAGGADRGHVVHFAALHDAGALTTPDREPQINL